MELETLSQSGGPTVFLSRPFLVKLYSYLRHLAFGVLESEVDKISVLYIPFSGPITRGYVNTAPAIITFHAPTGFPVISMLHGQAQNPPVDHPWGVLTSARF